MALGLVQDNGSVMGSEGLTGASGSAPLPAAPRLPGHGRHSTCFSALTVPSCGAFGGLLNLGSL